jgi:hypothetical protein
MSELISRTGRVQAWIDDPSGRLPVSCTVMNVENELEGPNGIEASWRFASHALRKAQELQSIYQNLTHEASRESLASLRVVLYHLDESIRLLTKLSDGGSI